MTSIVVHVITDTATHDSHLAALNKWIHAEDGTSFQVDTIETKPDKRLAASIAIAEARPHPSVVVISGFSDLDLTPHLERLASAGIETVVDAGSRADGDPAFPSASLLSNSRLNKSGDLVSAVRKAATRIKVGSMVAVRVIETREEFEAYFRLRYLTYEAKGYLPVEHRNATKWDVDFNDRGAIAIGAFNKTNDDLVGCCRLLSSIGETGPHEEMVVRMVQSTNDSQLANQIKWPLGREVFDLLTSFDEFSECYRDLVRRKIKHGEVSRVIVDAPHRGKRVGEVLIDSLITLAEYYKNQVLFLACEPIQENFYKKSGFSRLGDWQCRSFVEVNVTAIGMVRGLSGFRAQKSM